MQGLVSARLTVMTIKGEGRGKRVSHKTNVVMCDALFVVKSPKDWGEKEEKI